MAGQSDARPPRDVTSRAWLAGLDAHAAEHGFHVQLGDRHGALFTEDGETLLVTFERADLMRETPTGLPFGLSVAGKEGWSQLAFWSEGRSWFRDEAVFAFVDDLVDDAFFDRFDSVVFYGAGAEGYAACAFSVAAPGAVVLAVRPHATQDPRIAGWDRRHLEARRRDFASRYGFAPDMLDGAAQAFVLHDPAEREDAMHAALFTRPNVLPLRCPHLGRRTEEELDALGLLVTLIREAGRGRLDARRFARLWRRRRAHAPYLRHVQNRLDAAHRPYLKGLWCRSALALCDRPRLRRGLEEAVAALAVENRALPAPRALPYGG